MFTYLFHLKPLALDQLCKRILQEARELFFAPHHSSHLALYQPLRCDPKQALRGAFTQDSA